jgi:MFS family permease
MSLALAGGAGVGFAASALFLPFLQTNLAGTTPTPPFLVLIGWGEAAWLCLVFGVVYLITLASMLALLARKIFPAEQERKLRNTDHGRKRIPWLALITINLFWLGWICAITPWARCSCPCWWIPSSARASATQLWAACALPGW